MAHQLVLVLLPDLRGSIVDQVEEALLPHCGEPIGDELRFDFYKIGGRWNGVFAGGMACDVNDGESNRDLVQGNICRVSDLPPVIETATTPDLVINFDAGVPDDLGLPDRPFEPASVITPDGRLHFFGWRFDNEPLDAQQPSLCGAFSMSIAPATQLRWMLTAEGCGSVAARPDDRTNWLPKMSAGLA